ncbi:MAG TPA: tetratricopeptide repeat protein, partial [Kofleriaceae bacterium]|nr:tetratricopeptide repeat protein [Kofleriaceae bacterium]
PFLDKTVGDLIIAHNTLPPTPPSELVPSISSALERTILRALAKHPEERFPTMEAFAAALSAQLPNVPSVAGEATPLARPRGYSAPPPITHGAQRASAVSAIATSPSRWSRRRIGLVAGAAVAVVALGGGAFVMLRGGGKHTVRPRAAGGRPTIAVLDLADRAPRPKPENAWLATALGEVVTSDLQTGRQLDVMTAAEVARMKVDLGIDNAAEWSADQLARVRSDLGADYIITGSYLSVGGQLKVDAKLYDTAAGVSVARLSETGQESDLIGLGSRISGDAKRELGIVVEDEAPPPVTALPAKASAARYYSEGLDKARRFDLIEARDLFTKAAAEDPNEPLVHSALANVWRDLGYNDKARTEAKLAFDNASSLPKENRRAIEAQYRETSAQWDQALVAYKDLFEDYPTHLEYGLALAGVQTHAGDVKSAYATLAKLRKLPPPLGSDPRIELAEAKAAEEADDFERMRIHAEKAAVWANKRGARQLRALALHKQGWALFTQGHDVDAMALYEEAKKIFTELGDRSGLARTLNNIGLVQHRRHDDTDANRTYEQALKLAKDIGDTEAQSWVLNNWGYVHADAGELAKALELYQRKIALGEERGETANSQAVAHLNVSEVLRWQGDLAGARQHCRAAEDLLRGIDARRFAAFTAEYCGEVSRAEDDLAGAKKYFAQAIGWASDVMTPAESAEMRIAMARAELDDGRAQEAEALARGAVADLADVKEGSQRVCAIATLANALLARGQTQDAVKEIAATASLPSEGVSFACRIAAEIAGARVMAAVDPAKKADALVKLEDTRKRAAAATFVQQELEARLAIGELQGPAGRAGLKTLTKDAETLGFKRVARKAKSLAR